MVGLRMHCAAYSQVPNVLISTFVQNFWRVCKLYIFGKLRVWRNPKPMLSFFSKSLWSPSLPFKMATTKIKRLHWKPLYGPAMLFPMNFYDWNVIYRHSGWYWTWLLRVTCWEIWVICIMSQLIAENWKMAIILLPLNLERWSKSNSMFVMCRNSSMTIVQSCNLF